MSHKASDAIVWLGLGATLFVGFQCVVHTLRYLVNHIEPDDSVQDIRRDGVTLVEQINEINSESLGVLATCQHVNIRKAATRILLERVFTNKTAIVQILHDAQDPSVDEEIRHRAENAVAFFCTGHHRTQLLHRLRSQTDVGEDREILHDHRWALSTLRSLLRADDDEISLENGENLLNYLQDNMEDLNLTTEERGELQTLRDRWPEVLEQLQQENAALLPDGPRPRRRRVNDGSPQEQARRRRRREAMVLNEGDHPLGQEDIFQRRRTEEGVPRG